MPQGISAVRPTNGLYVYKDNEDKFVEKRVGPFYLPSHRFFNSAYGTFVIM